jgi:hypothetical protein
MLIEYTMALMMKLIRFDHRLIMTGIGYTHRCPPRDPGSQIEALREQLQKSANLRYVARNLMAMNNC